jgi:branched-chain amino acid transport system substrate-binding protein
MMTTRLIVRQAIMTAPRGRANRIPDVQEPPMQRFLPSTAILAAALLAAPLSRGGGARAAEPVRIGVTTILSGPTADRGQSEQYGVELALGEINAAGGVLGRPVAAIYGDNGANPAKGIQAAHRLIDQQHVPVLLGALATPVTHAIEPIVKAAEVPLVIDISGGQDFVDASGVGGNPYLFKTIPSNLDIAARMIGWLKAQGAHRLAMIADDVPLNRGNDVMFVRAARDAGLEVVADETLTKGADPTPVIAKLKALAPDHLISNLGPSTAAFFRAYEGAGWDVPVAGRIDVAGAVAAVSPKFLADGGLSKIADIVVFTPLQDTPGVKAFAASYQAKYGLVPTQRAFFAYESTYLVVDAIRRAGTDTPAAITAALKSSTMGSRLGGGYAMDDHNHPQTPMPVLGVRDGKVAVIQVLPPPA